jgi:transposase
VERESQIIDFSVDVVGVDLGVKSKATLSTDEVFEGA